MSDVRVIALDTSTKPVIVIYEPDANAKAILVSRLNKCLNIIRIDSIERLEVILAERPFIGLVVRLDLPALAFLKGYHFLLKKLNVKIVGLLDTDTLYAPGDLALANATFADSIDASVAKKIGDWLVCSAVNV